MRRGAPRSNRARADGRRAPQARGAPEAAARGLVRPQGAWYTVQVVASYCSWTFPPEPARPALRAGICNRRKSALRPGSSVVERGPEKAGVGGSIPSLATIPPRAPNLWPRSRGAPSARKSPRPLDRPASAVQSRPWPPFHREHQIFGRALVVRRAQERARGPWIGRRRRFNPVPGHHSLKSEDSRAARCTAVQI
jgi:hypothetical protein